jgi:dinuclear metal center YbgI/SA1388 family protein
VATLNDVLAYLKDLAPEDTALPDDPVGLLIGSASRREITCAGVCLDATPAAVETAVSAGAELVVAHHPLIYRPLKRIDWENDPIGRAVAALVKADAALYAMHTNWDRATVGTNAVLAAKLNLEAVRPLATEGEIALPRIGRLPTPLTLEAFASLVETRLGCGGTSRLRYTQETTTDRIINTVAVCGGAGAFLAADILRAGADAYVTSDVRHHEFIDAAGRGLALFDAGHYATEAPGMMALSKLLRQHFPEINVVWCDSMA